jgi:N-acetylmuramoyl-L-alanine amidase
VTGFVVVGARLMSSDASPSARSRPAEAVDADPASTQPTRPPTMSSRTVPGALAGRTILVDAGHNGGNASHAEAIDRSVFIGTMSRACDTTGTQTDDGYTEHEYTLDVALRLRDLLQQAGGTVVMVRTDDSGWGPCIDERAKIGNDAHADVGISIHADGGPVGGRGFHVNAPASIPGYTDDIYAASKRLAVELRDAFLVTGMPTSTYFGRDGLIERRDFGGLNLSSVPKVLFETGNMRNPTDARLLEDPQFRAQEAVALRDGLAGFLAQRP